MVPNAVPQHVFLLLHTYVQEHTIFTRYLCCMHPVLQGLYPQLQVCTLAAADSLLTGI